jgi:hypothetical protein
MKDLDKKLEELIKMNEDIKRKIDELDASILSDPTIPDSIKDELKSIKEINNQPEVTDGLIIKNKIIGYDPDTFEAIYDHN